MLSRVLPSIYRDSHVHRLPLFFRRLRAALAALAPRRRRQPAHRAAHARARATRRTSSTPSSPAISATRSRRATTSRCATSACGCARSTGCRPVDVILRRVDGAFCDPLELRADSLLGAPGLLQAARQGHVAIVNPLGSSVLENPALMAFLPRAGARAARRGSRRCRRCRPGGAATPSERAYVLEHLEHLVVKPICPHRQRLHGVRRGARAAARARRSPTRSAPSPISSSVRSTSRCRPRRSLVDGRLEPRPMVLRSFLVADGDGYTVMPGGLSRVAPDARQRGGVEPARRRQQGRLGARLRARARGEPAGSRPTARCRSRAAATTCRGASPTTSSGSAATPSAPRAARACCARSCAACSISTRRRTTRTLPLLLRAVTRLTATFPGFVGSGAAERLAGAGSASCARCSSTRAAPAACASTSPRWCAPAARCATASRPTPGA